MTSFFRAANCFWLVIPAFAIVFFLAGTALTVLNRIEGEVINLRQRVHDGGSELRSLYVGIEREVTNLRQGIPREYEQKLRDIESRLNDRKQWPQDPAAAEKLRQGLDEIVQALSPVAAERILPKLARLNWGIEALWNLRTHANAAPNQLEEVQSTINEVLESQPRGHFNEIYKELETRLREIDPQIRVFQRNQLLERAKQALDGKDDAGAVFTSLEEFGKEFEVAAVLPKLRSTVLEKTGLERIESFNKNLKKTLSFADDRARQVSLLTIQEGSLRLTVDLELEDAAPPEVVQKAKSLLALCDKELVELATKQQGENAKKLRGYQSWALDQIRKFDSPQGWYYDITLPWVEKELHNFGNATEEVNWGLFANFPSTRKLLEERLKIDLSETTGAKLTVAQQKTIYSNIGSLISWTGSVNTEIAYRVTRDSMVKYLLPIQPHLLDPPVAQLYQQAFSKGWQKLEGREDQLFVAQQSAIIQKKTLEELYPPNP